MGQVLIFNLSFCFFCSGHRRYGAFVIVTLDDMDEFEFGRRRGKEGRKDKKDHKTPSVANVPVRTI